MLCTEMRNISPIFDVGGLNEVSFGTRRIIFQTTKLCTPVLLAALVSGCTLDPIKNFSSQSRSPDGKWLAIGETLENAGFGSGAIWSEISLKRVGSQNDDDAVQVLGVEQACRSIGLTLRWLSSTHLLVTYNNADVTFRRKEVGDAIIITVRDLKSKDTDNPKCAENS